jgi:hypothetical protein
MRSLTRLKNLEIPNMIRKSRRKTQRMRVRKVQNMAKLSLDIG